MSIIIYGAGTYGRYAYWEYVDKEEILFFVDRNKSIGGGYRDCRWRLKGLRY